MIVNVSTTKHENGSKDSRGQGVKDTIPPQAGLESSNPIFVLKKKSGEIYD